MLDSFGSIDDIGRNIQLAVAPVFLLSGIGAILNVLASRLGRVVDRARQIEREIVGLEPAARQGAIANLALLDRRISYAHFAITLCTISALLVCCVVAILFVGDLLDVHKAGIVAVLFVAAMATLIVGLLLFLTEVRIATRSVRVRAEYMVEHRG